MIELKHLDKKFNKNSSHKIHVINDISLTFPEKGLVVLLGPSGSGKTTLLNVVGGLDKPDKGIINFYGKEIKKYKSNVWDKLRVEDVGYIFQNYYLMNELSVFDNVAFVLKLIGINDKSEIETRVNYILKQVGMFKYRKKRASQLSGGQQQRVAIARALVKNPKVIIADEPTGNLDSANTIDVMNIIKTISLNKLVILVTHEKELANFYGDRIIELKDGSIINDYKNDTNQDHSFDSDNTIYLKDMHQLSSLKDNNFEAQLYSESDEIVETTVKLIIKNKTLYIDVNSPITKIKLNNESINLKIVDEHYKKKTREEILTTSFNEEVLKHDNLKKEKQLVVSTKNSFWIAVRKFLNYKRRGKMLLFLFMLSGVLFAFSFISIYTYMTKSIDSYIEYDENSLILESGKDAEQIYNEIYSISGNNFDVTLESYSQVHIELGFPDYYLRNDININVASTMDQTKLIHGRSVENENEVVISQGIYSKNLQDQTELTSIGIWSLENLLGETIRIHQHSYKVVGITNSLHDVIYLKNYNELYFIANNYLDLTGLLTEEEYKYEVFKFVRNQNDKMIIKSNDTSKLEEGLKKLNYEVYNVLESAKNNRDEDVKTSLNNFLPLLSVITGASLIAFFFVMRSSMISRIYEIAVYRALGVKKIEIYSSFAVEISILTLISSFVGYLGLSLVLYLVSDSPMSGFFTYSVNFISVSLGMLCLLLLNLIVGLLPMFTLMRKTPSQILSTYDM